MATWIEMDDRTSYAVQADGAVLVSVRADDDEVAEDETAISDSLGARLGGTWGRSTEWSAAGGECDVTSRWVREAAAS